MTRRYTGANEQFRVDARILDGATFRIAGAKALAEGTESFDKVLPDLADRPDMFLDDELVGICVEINRVALSWRVTFVNLHAIEQTRYDAVTGTTSDPHRRRRSSARPWRGATGKSGE